MGIISR